MPLLVRPLRSLSLNLQIAEKNYLSSYNAIGLEQFFKLTRTQNFLPEETALYSGLPCLAYDVFVRSDSFLQQPSVIICKVVIRLRNTWRPPRSKNDHDDRDYTDVKLLLMLGRGRCWESQGKWKAFQAFRETQNGGKTLVIEPIAGLSACSFLPGAVNLAKPSYTFFCSLQCVEKVTAQMIPSSSPFKF